MDAQEHDKFAKADTPGAEVGRRLAEKLGALRAAIDKGFSGEFKEFDIDRIKQRLSRPEKDDSDI